MQSTIGLQPERVRESHEDSLESMQQSAPRVQSTIGLQPEHARESDEDSAESMKENTRKVISGFLFLLHTTPH